MSNPKSAHLDRDAVIEALQDQIDDLTATCEEQQRQLDAQWQVIQRLAARINLTLPDQAGR